MDDLEQIRNFLVKEKEKLEGSLKQASESRQDSAVAMESQRDATHRVYYEDMEENLKQQIKILENQITAVATFGPTIIAKVDGQIKEIVLVPSGMGGRTIENMMLVSVDTPIGEKLAGKKAGESFEFNGQTWTVEKVE